LSRSRRSRPLVYSPGFGNISELTCPPSRQDARRRSAKLSRSIELRDGTELDTLADAAQFILGLHEAYQDRNSWRRASELLMEAAERGGSIEAATEQFELALFLEARYVRQ
jgi:hypothetical protein